MLYNKSINVLNLTAIHLLELLNIDRPTQKQINTMETFIAVALQNSHLFK